MKKEKPFATEAELCTTFISAVDSKLWTAYAETAGWDILLARKADGFQIGIQAKLVFNVHVLNQTLDGWGWEYRVHGPDCRAVLVPENGNGGLATIAAHVGVTIITCRPKGKQYGSPFHPYLPTSENAYSSADWHELSPETREVLPAYVPDVVAGDSAPVQLTSWKIAALKIAAIGEVRGYVTRADFRALKVDPRRWVAARWMTARPEGFMLHPDLRFRTQHPKVYAQIKADIQQWFPKLGLLPLTAAPMVLIA